MPKILEIERTSCKCEEIEQHLQSLQNELQQLHTDHIQYQEEYSTSCEEWKHRQMEVWIDFDS